MSKDSTVSALKCSLASMVNHMNDYSHLDICTFLKDLHNLNDDQFTVISNNLTEIISQDVKNSKTREDYCCKTHKICLDSTANEKFKAIFQVFDSFKQLPCTLQKFAMSLFFQDFFQKLMLDLRIGVADSVLKEKKKKEKELKLYEELNLPLNENFIDDNVKPKKNLDTLHYVAGFIMHRLAQKECPKSIMGALLKNTNSNCDKANVTDDYEDWTRTLDREKLLIVTEGCFQLFHKMKTICDNFYHYNVSQLRESKIKDLASKAILKELSEDWKNLTNGDIQWFSKVIDIFLNTRGKVLVKDCKEEYQYQNKESIKRKFALRKALKEKMKNDSQLFKNTKGRKKNSPTKKVQKIKKPKVIGSTSHPIESSKNDFSFLNDDPDADLFLQYI